MISVAPDLNGQNLFTVIESGTYTIPTVSTIVSPTTQYLAKSLDSIRNVVGGQLTFSFSDAASGSPGGAVFLGIALSPGDVVACSAVAGGKITVTVNGLTVATITATTVGGVVGFYS